MISIALASYNGEKFIREQLDSILAQTVTDWELVACDDRSSDGTPAILREYAARDGRIRVYENEENLGFRRNFEQAVSRCTGEYTAFSDQDDIWYPDHLEMLLSGLGTCSLVTANAMLADAEGRETGVTARDTDKMESIPDDSDEAFFLMLYRPYVQGAASLAKTAFLKACLPIPEGVRFHDQWFGVMAALSGGVAYVPECVLRYRMHGNNVTGRTKWCSMKKIREAFFGGGNRRLYREQLAFLDSLTSSGIIPEKQGALEQAQLLFRNFVRRRPYDSFPFWMRNYFRIYRSRNPLFFLIRLFRIFVLLH